MVRGLLIVGVILWAVNRSGFNPAPADPGPLNEQRPAAGNFQYQKSDYNSAKSHVNFFKTRLQKEGRARMGK